MISAGKGEGLSMKIRKYILAVMVVLMAGAIPAAGKNAATVWKTDDVTGLWWSQKKESQMEIYAKGDKYYGKLVWVIKNPGKLDVKNHDPKLRTRVVLGSDIFTDFVFNGKDTWEKGFLYDPSSGNTYQGYLKMESQDALSVNGFINLPLIGRVGGSNKFTRVVPGDELAGKNVLPQVTVSPTAITGM